MSARVRGKTALVTGAAQGIGAACAHMLAREGARVLLTDVNIERAREKASEIDAELGSGTAFAFRHDVANETIGLPRSPSRVSRSADSPCSSTTRASRSSDRSKISVSTIGVAV